MLGRRRLSPDQPTHAACPLAANRVQHCNQTTVEGHGGLNGCPAHPRGPPPADSHQSTHMHATFLQLQRRPLPHAAAASTLLPAPCGWRAGPRADAPVPRTLSAHAASRAAAPCPPVCVPLARAASYRTPRQNSRRSHVRACTAPSRFVPQPTHNCIGRMPSLPRIQHHARCACGCFPWRNAMNDVAPGELPPAQPP